MSRGVVIGVVVTVGLAVGAGYWWGANLSTASAEKSADVRQAAPNKTSSTKQRKILYYRHPMGLPDTSPVPKKDSMGMAYVPVYDDEQPVGPGFVVPSEKLQRLGVRTALAESRALARTVRAVGTVQIDERRQTAVSPKFEGYVTRLYVATTGAPVRRGQPLLEVYSPELVSAQEEFRIARENLAALREATPEIRGRLERLVDASRLRLINWGVELRDLNRIERVPESNNVLIRSPANGVVVEKLGRVGQRFMPGEALYQIAALDHVWLVANVFEQDIALLATGRPASANFEAYPGRIFTGRVAFVYPTLEPQTRTLAVRIDMPNPEGALKPGLYGTVEISGPAITAAVTVPVSAVLDSGTRQLVFVASGEGRFEAREVQLAERSEGFVAVSRGLAAGESVVVDGNFLIDAESNLRAGTQALGHAHDKAATEQPASPAEKSVAGSNAHSDHEKPPAR